MSDTTVTLSAAEAALMAKLLAGAKPDATPAEHEQDAARRAYEVYRARVTRGTPKSYERWVAENGDKQHAPRPAANDSEAEIVAKIARRSDCVAVAKVGGKLIGIYRFTRKSDGMDRITASGEGSDEVQRTIVGLLSAYVIATGPAAL